jgi:hypothetical protein
MCYLLEVGFGNYPWEEPKRDLFFCCYYNLPIELTENKNQINGSSKFGSKNVRYK